MSAIEASLAKIDEEIGRLERRAEPLRAKLMPIEDKLAQLRKVRQAKVAGELGGRAPRRPKHDYQSAFRTYDAYEGRGALKLTSEKHGIPLRTLTWALAKRSRG